MGLLKYVTKSSGMIEPLNKVLQFVLSNIMVFAFAGVAPGNPFSEYNSRLFKLIFPSASGTVSNSIYPALSVLFPSILFNSISRVLFCGLAGSALSTT